MTCSADLCFKSQIISKGFNGRHGRAYLISPLIPSYLPHLHAEGSARLDRTSECQSSPVPLALSCLLGVENSALDNQPEDPVLLRQTGGITLPNTYLHKPAQRRLITGEHTVADLACKICGRTLGWKYVAASEEAQRYKVGKFIIEMGRVRTMPHWEGLGSEDEVQAVLNTAAPGSSVVDGDETQVESGDDEVEEEHWAVERARRPRMRGEDKRSGADSMVTDENVEFDSEDEDECEDLFAGVWSPTLARRWRRLRSLRTAIRKL